MVVGIYLNDVFLEDYYSYKYMAGFFYYFMFLIYRAGVRLLKIVGFSLILLG